MSAPLIFLCLQITDKLHFLCCQWAATLSRIMNLFARQNSYNRVFLILLRQGSHTDITFLPRMAERNIFTVGDGIYGLFYEKKEAVEVM